MSEREEFLKHIRKDEAYKEMYSFILEGFSKGEIFSLQEVISRYYGKNPNARSFDNWDVAMLFNIAVSSLEQEGKVHRMLGKYVIDVPKETIKVQENSREER